MLESSIHKPDGLTNLGMDQFGSCDTHLEPNSPPTLMVVSVLGVGAEPARAATNSRRIHSKKKKHELTQDQIHLASPAAVLLQPASAADLRPVRRSSNTACTVQTTASGHPEGQGRLQGRWFGDREKNHWPARLMVGR